MPTTMTEVSIEPSIASRMRRPLSGSAPRAALMRPLNPYVEEISNIQAPELIQAFAESAPQEVQAAIRQTVVSLLGNLPAHLYETSVMSTGQHVASLMYSMQATIRRRRASCGLRVLVG